MSARLISRALACVSLLAFATIAAQAAEPGNIVAPVVADRQPVDRIDSHADEVALRYYASQKQTARVDAEIARLRKLYPDWQPPADLWTAPVGGSDDRQLWDLFGANKLDELRAAIAARRAKDSNWRPSADLEKKLKCKELRVRILAYARSNRWGDLIDLSDKWRAEIASDDLEALWLLAEAFTRKGRSPEALWVLDAAMKGAKRSNDRIATIEKAISLALPMSGIEDLLALGKADSTGRNEMETIAVDITRARISARLHDMPCKDVTAAELAKFGDFAATSPDPDQLALLGWYGLKQSRLDDAFGFFKSAISKGGDATVAQGLIISLRRLGRLRDAEEVAYAWREPLPANTTFFIDIVADQLAKHAPLDEKRLTRYADVVLQTNSGEGAEALGWYAYETCQSDAAAQWFKRAVSWLPKETAVLGYAISLQRLHRRAEVVQLANRYDGLFPTVVALLFPTERTVDRCLMGPGTAALQTSAATASATLAAVPLPGQLQSVALDIRAITRGEFPIPVGLDNPLRCRPSERILAAKAPAGVWRPADPVLPITDARRVPGVGAMPYERLGRTLLAGFGGVQQPSSAPDRILRAPQGTLWAAEQVAAIASAGQPQAAAPAVGQFAGISAVASTSTSARTSP